MDRRLASLKAAKMRLELNETWERLTGCSQADAGVSAGTEEPTQRDLEIAATDAAFTGVGSKLHDLLRSKHSDDACRYERLTESLNEQRKRLARTRDTHSSALWAMVAARCIAGNGWLLPKESEGYRKFLGMIADAALEAFRLEAERRNGTVDPQPTSKVVLSGLEAKMEAAPPGESTMELFERYAAMRLAEKRKRPDTVNQDRKVVQQFASFVGANRSIRSIDAAEVRDWRNTVALLPPNYKKMKAYQGLTLREAAAHARAAGKAGLSPTTINKYLSTISPLFSWCTKEGYAGGNPCDLLFYDIPKNSNPRPPFSGEQLESIFSSPLFTGFAGDGLEHEPGNIHARDWRKWIPLVCLFTGARIGEIAQLHVDDIKQEQEIWFILIRDDEVTGQRTKSGYSRPVPVHSQLQKIGFLGFVQKQRERAAGDGNPQLFPELRPNERGQISGTPSRFWRDYLKAIAIKNGRDGFGSHSFRHTMADQLRLAGYLDDEIEVALGHNQKSVTSGYGNIRQGTVERLSKMFEQVSFEEVCLSHLYDSNEVSITSR
jgi:integrase